MFGFNFILRSIHLVGLVISIIFKEILLCFMPKSKKSITDDIILITGGGRGIGRKLALKFAAYNPKHMIIWGRTEESLSSTVEDVRKMKINCSYMLCDVSSKEEIYAVAKEVEAKFGHITILVNNAGVVFPCSVLDASPELTEQTIRTNAMAQFWAIRVFLPNMLERGKGHIVNMSSMLGWAGLNGASDYCASKFASSGLSDALIDELACSDVKDVTVTAVYPYHVNNSMFAGVTTRFPRLFPSLDEDYVAHSVVEGVLVNRNKILVPKMMYPVAFFYSIAPVRAVTSIMKLLGVDRAIELYQKHQQEKGLQSAS